MYSMDSTRIAWGTEKYTLRQLLVFQLTIFPFKSKLLEWLSLRDMTLDEILHHNGLGDYLGHQECYICHNKPRVFKCKDCSGGGRLCCQLCILKAHQDMPLHHIEVSYFTNAMEMSKLILIGILAMDRRIFRQGLS